MPKTQELEIYAYAIKTEDGQYICACGDSVKKISNTCIRLYETQEEAALHSRQLFFKHTVIGLALMDVELRADKDKLN